jgi:hypothetical protein
MHMSAISGCSEAYVTCGVKGRKCVCVKGRGQQQKEVKKQYMNGSMATHQVEVDHLLHHKVAGLDTEHHLVEQTADVDAQSHVGDYFFNHLPLAARVAIHVYRLEKLSWR